VNAGGPVSNGRNPIPIMVLASSPVRLPHGATTVATTCAALLSHQCVGCGIRFPALLPRSLVARCGGWFGAVPRGSILLRTNGHPQN
jgi:hypothetical protein